MQEYKIQHKILTVAECVIIDKKDQPAFFSSDEIEFSHWEFNYRDGWISDAWLAESAIYAVNFHEAFRIFIDKLMKIIPRIALISQCYIEYFSEPILVYKVGSNVAFFRYTTDMKPVGLMFSENEQRALGLLMEMSQIPEEFYFYWNDAVNATGYSSKLLLMFSAIEALVKRDGRKNWDLIKVILGEELSKELFGNKEKSSAGLRNRLVHGEYFNDGDGKKNYLNLVHQKIITYFNESIFSEKLLHDNIVNPQRHPFGNKSMLNNFIKLRDNTFSFNLKNILKDFDENGYRTPKNYEYHYDKTLEATY